MHQLEKDFLLYGEFDINSTKSIMELLDSLHNRTSTLEYILEIKETEWNIRIFDVYQWPSSLQPHDPVIH